MMTTGAPQHAPEHFLRYFVHQIALRNRHTVEYEFLRYDVLRYDGWLSSDVFWDLWRFK